MNYLYRAQNYLNSVVSIAESLVEIATNDELKTNAEVRYKITEMLLQLERDADDFVIDMELDAEYPLAVITNNRRFFDINTRLIKCLEKIQLQGYRFDKFIKTLKLENETLKRECDFL